MKKLYLFALMALLLAGCKADDGPLMGDGWVVGPEKKLYRVEQIHQILEEQGYFNVDQADDETLTDEYNRGARSSSATFDLGIGRAFAIHAGDCAVVNGSSLNEKISVSSSSKVASDDQLDYLVIDYKKQLRVTIGDCDKLYKAYQRKMAANNKPYIDGSGVLTIEYYLWLGTVTDQKFTALTDVSSAYVLGAKDKFVECSKSSDEYSVKANALRGTLDDKGYVKITVQIQPKVAF